MRSITLLFLLVLFIPSVNFSQEWVCDCDNRIPITVSGNTDELTDFQVKIEVPFETGMETDFSNLLITDGDKVTELNHWVQTADTGTTGVVWVKVPTIPVGGKTLYIYYGDCAKGGAAPEDVFEYFNDFDSAAGGTNLRSGEVIAEDDNGTSVLTKVTNCDPAGAWFPLGFTINDYVLVTRETRHTNSFTDCNLNRYGLENSDFDGYNIIRNGVSGNSFGYERRDNEAGGNSNTLNPSTNVDEYYITELRRCTATNLNEAEIYESDGTSIGSVSGSIAGHNYSGFDRFTVRGGRDYRIDYTGVAKKSCDDISATAGTAETYNNQDCVILPIKLSSFSVEQTQEGTLITWETASEQDNDFFTIEKSLDGIEFFELTRVVGNGTTSSINSYEYVDTNDECGSLFYRLKQTDFDGTFDYPSDVLQIVRVCDNAQFKVYPNPVKDLVSISFLSEMSFTGEITVLSTLGNHVISYPVEVTEGLNEINIDVNELRPGVFKLQLKPNGEKAIETKTIIKVKG